MTCLRFYTLSPFSVTLENVPDRELGPLLTHLADAGFENPLIKPFRARAGSRKAAASARGRKADLPEDWSVVRERKGESYQWPDARERYSRYRVFMVFDSFTGSRLADLETPEGGTRSESHGTARLPALRTG